MLFFRRYAVLLLLLFSSTSKAATYYVATNGSDAAAGTSWATARRTIQAAVDLTADGDTVIVSNGVYATGTRVFPDTTTSNRVVITNNITVQSLNGAKVTAIAGVDNGVSNASSVRCVFMASAAQLTGFTLTNGVAPFVPGPGASIVDGMGGGVFVVELGGTLNDCVLSGNSAYFLGGGAAGCTLNNCAISGNYSANAGGGTYQSTLNNCYVAGNVAESFGGGSEADTLVSCVVSGNSANNGGGADSSSLFNCTVSGNSALGAGGGANNSTQYNCIVYFNAAPSGPNYASSTLNASCTTPAPGGGTGTITNQPRFRATNDFRLATNSPCIDAGSNVYVSSATDVDGNPRIVDGTVDMGAYELTTSHFVAPGGGAIFPYSRWADAATNIQDAVDAAKSGEIVVVSNGVYATGSRVTPGYSTSNRVVITNNITVQSAHGPSVTSINGAKNGDSYASIRCAYISAGSLVGFTLTNGYAPSLGVFYDQNRGGGGAYLAGGSLSNCTLSGNSASVFGGGSYSGVLYNCTLSGNAVTNGQGGASIYGTLNHCVLSGNAALDGGGAAYATLNNCTVTGNLATNDLGGGAVYATLNSCVLSGNKALAGGAAAASTLNNCTVSGNAANGGGGAYLGTLNNCIVYFNSDNSGFPNYFNATFDHSCTTPDPGTGSGNMTNQPRFVATNNFDLATNSPCRDAGNNALVVGATDIDGDVRIMNGTVDIGAYEFGDFPVHYVAPGGASFYPYGSWAYAATNIQAGVDAAKEGELVIVSNGVYATGARAAPGFSTPNRVLITADITVQSVNGPAVTSIVGTNNGTSTNSARCVFITAGTLSGFTLTNGFAPALSSAPQDQDGGGAYAAGGSLTNCTLSGNKAAGSGGGSYYGTLDTCTLKSNSCSSGDGGGSYYGTLNHCMLIGNKASGNGGGSYDGTLNSCTLSSNVCTGGNGGGSYNGTLNNCILVNNLCTGTGDCFGGGAAGSALYNCTVIRNNAFSAFLGTSYGGGTFFAAVINCIVVSNNAQNGANYDTSSLVNSCATPSAGSSNITNDPQFVAWAAGNFRIKATSPCINTGTNGFAPGVTDYDGNPRIEQGTVDMGAYEFQPITNYLGWSLQIPNGQIAPEQFGTGDGYPNLLKYATGSSATNSDELASLSDGLTTNGLFTVLFTRNTNAHDITIVVERGNALTNGASWTGIATNKNGTWGSTTNVSEIAGAPASVTVQDPLPATNRFLRLRVTRP